MANRSKTVHVIREMIRLWTKENRSKSEIMQSLNLSRPTLNKYIKKLEELTKTDSLEALISKTDSELDEQFHEKSINQVPEKQSQLYKIFPEMRGILAKPGETLKRRWEAYQTLNPDGYEYSRFCYHYSQWCKIQKVWMHQEHKAGEKMFVDFTGEHLYLTERITGRKVPVEVFVAILGCSQATFAKAAYSQTLEDWISLNESAFNFFGGVTRAIVPDNLKSGVTKADKYEPEINPAYSDFARHYETVILPTRVRHPKDKPLVEGAVKILYTRIFAPLRDEIHYDLDSLNERIEELLEDHNETKFQKKDGSRWQLLEEVERPALKKLPEKRFELPKYAIGKVWFNYHIPIPVENHFYSVPYTYVGKQVKIRYTATLVEIYYGYECIAVHSRGRGKGAYTTNADHMPSYHRWYADWSPEKIISLAKKIGPETVKMTEKIMGEVAFVEQGFRACMGIISLHNKYEKNRIEKACRRAISLGAFKYKTVCTILEKGLDHQPEVIQQQPVNLYHENIRGKDYYENLNKGVIQ